MLASSVAASLILASNSVTFLNKKGALSEDMSYNFSETAMTERRGFPSSQRKILYNS